MKEIKLSATPLIALKNKVLFPYEVVSLVFEREQSLLALNNAMDEGVNPIFVFQKSDDHEIDPNNLYTVGTIGKIVRIWRMPEGPTGVLVEGLDPVKIDKITETDSGLWAEYSALNQKNYEANIEVEALVRNITNVFRDIVNMGVSIPLSVMNEIINDTSLTKEEVSFEKTKQFIANAFYCYDYLTARKEYIESENKRNENLNIENYKLQEKKEELGEKQEITIKDEEAIRKINNFIGLFFFSLHIYYIIIFLFCKVFL